MNARAVASACAKLGLECEVHIGAVDAEKVSLNKDITELYGAKIIECHDSTKTLLPAMAARISFFRMGFEITLSMPASR